MAADGLPARAVADLVGGRLLGDGGTVVRGIGSLDRAGPDTLSILVSPKYLSQFRSSRAGVVLLRDECATEAHGPVTRIVVPDPYRALLIAAQTLVPTPPSEPGIDPTARLGAGVALGRDVVVGAYAVLGRDVRLGDRVRLGPGVVLEDGVEVGDDTVLGPRVTCCSGSVLGRHVVIKAGSVIGGIGYGYLDHGDGHSRIPHVGRCVIGDEVEIGSNCCVDRGSLDDTVVGRGTKIDNLVQIGHNARIGERSLIVAGCLIAGSARIGNDVILAGRVIVADHVSIGDRARISGGSGVSTDVPAGAVYSGFYARSHRLFLRAQAAFYALPDIIKDLERLVKERNERA